MSRLEVYLLAIWMMLATIAFNTCPASAGEHDMTLEEPPLLFDTAVFWQPEECPKGFGHVKVDVPARRYGDFNYVEIECGKLAEPYYPCSPTREEKE